MYSYIRFYNLKKFVILTNIRGDVIKSYVCVRLKYYLIFL